jgi:trehalose 6-phosphate synthase
MWQLLPDPADYTSALGEYDVVGFHTRQSLHNYVHCCKQLLGAEWNGRELLSGYRHQIAGTYPIGIEPGDFLPPHADRASAAEGELKRVVRGRRILLGVDRLDYTKGIPERILAFEELVRRYPEWRKKVSFVQIASPSRVDVAQYAQQKRRIEELVGRVNGELAEHDWVPLRYLYRSYSRDRLGRFYRETDVGLVTPLRDGMNLVAMEFVAAQRPDSPGVLVLSRCAGAAEELPEAVIVNPYHPADVAAGAARALAMPLEERRERHATLLARVLANNASEWARSFVTDLECTHAAETELLPHQARA